MSRARITVLLLGLASPAVAQTGSPVAWTLTSGEFTIFGHTDYLPTLGLAPRVVYDTTRGVDSARVIDSVRASAPAPAGPAGLAAGLTSWPTSQYCAGIASATAGPLDPSDLLPRIQLAARCGVRLVLVFPRRLLTTNGQAVGPFSVDSARRATDRYAAVLRPDTLAKYRATLLGLNLADDYGCPECWGGKVITQAQIAEWAAYARVTLPGLPLGVRKTADWVAAYPALAPLLDYTWAQYHTRRGDAVRYFDDAAATAARLGLRVVMGVNVHDCDGAGTRPCDPAALARYGALAVNHPATCAFINWRYDEATWIKPEIRSVWDTLLAAAKARPAQECRRPTSTASAGTR